MRFDTGVPPYSTRALFGESGRRGGRLLCGEGPCCSSALFLRLRRSLFAPRRPSCPKSILLLWWGTHAPEFCWTVRGFPAGVHVPS